MPRRTTEQQILDLEAKIQGIKARAERKKVRANPAVKFMSMALRSLDKALNATEDAVIRGPLDEARATVSSCLSMCGVKPGAARRTLTPRPRAKTIAGPRIASTENGTAHPQPDANDLLAYLTKHPGSRSEHISSAHSTDAVALRPVLQKLIDDGKVRTEGERRGRRYFASV